VTSAPALRAPTAAEIPAHPAPITTTLFMSGSPFVYSQNETWQGFIFWHGTPKIKSINIFSDLALAFV
jgi:hypothetical protein